MKFTRTLEVLREYMEKVVADYKAKLIADGKDPSGQLVSTLTYMIDEETLTGYLVTTDYQKYVEEGRQPGKFPPLDAIRSWIEQKQIIPSENTSLDQLTYLIGRKIATVGIEPGEQLKDTISSLEDEWNERINAAIDEDLKRFVDDLPS